MGSKVVSAFSVGLKNASDVEAHSCIHWLWVIVQSRDLNTVGFERVDLVVTS